MVIQNILSEFEYGSQNCEPSIFNYHINRNITLNYVKQERFNLYENIIQKYKIL